MVWNGESYPVQAYYKTDDGTILPAWQPDDMSANKASASKIVEKEYPGSEVVSCKLVKDYEAHYWEVYFR